MRELSESEKHIIQRLNEWEVLLNQSPSTPYNIDISVLIHDLLKKFNAGYSYDSKNNEIKLFNTPWDVRNELPDNNRLRRDFISTVYFIDYLKSERLVYLVPPEETSDLSKTDIDFTINGRSDYVTHIRDEKFLNLFKEIFGQVIFPTEYIIQYYKRGNKTLETKRFETNKILTWIAIGLTFFIGLTGLLMNYQQISKKDNQILDAIHRLEEKTDKRFIELENKLNIKIETNHNEMLTRLDSIDIRLKRVEYEIFAVKPWENYYQEMTNKKVKKQ